MWPREEAIEFFAKRGEPLKVQLIEEKTAGQAEVSCYTIKDRDTFVDFCVGPHVPSTGKLKAFKLLTTSNAYWKGDARNQPMQRVYGTAFFKDEDLKQHLASDRGSEEARPPARRQGPRPVHVPSVGARRGVLAGQGHDALQPARRATCASVLFPAGYTEVKTPLIFNKGLWETSGHWQHYRQNMFLVESENVEMGVKADELPGPHARVRERGAQLSRPAAPVPRADAAPSQRSLGRARRASPASASSRRTTRTASSRSRRSARKSSGCSTWSSASTATSA